MKTSNKILLLFFVAAIFMITAVHLTLYAKYKKGEVSSFEEMREGRFEDHPLPAVKYVSVTGFRRCNIIPAAELKIRIFNKSSRLSYKVVNDTLVITGDSTVSDYEHQFLSRQAIHLYLPGMEQINAFHTELFLIGATDSVAAPSWKINLSKSGFTTGDFNNKNTFFNQILIKANDSYLTLNRSAVINELNIQTNNSTVNNQNAGIKHLQLSVDDNSTIVLKGKNIKDISVNKQ